MSQAWGLFCIPQETLRTWIDGIKKVLYYALSCCVHHDYILPVHSDKQFFVAYVGVVIANTLGGGHRERG